MANDGALADRLQLTLAKTTAAAFAVSSAEGPELFGELALRLAEILGVDAVIIGEFIGAAPDRMRTMAACLDGRLLRQFEYELEGTPCRGVVNRESRFATGIRNEFTPGTLFHAQGFDSYAARSMVDGNGRQIGLIAAMHRAPISDRELTEALLQIFAVRATAEIDRRRAEAAMRASEQSYLAIFNAAEDGIFVFDFENGAFIDVNTKACQAYGYTREQLMQKRVSELSSNVHPYTEDEAVKHLEAARKGKPQRFEWHRRNRDGSLHWDEVVLKRAMIGGAERIVAFTRDITARKTAHEALRLREEQYRAIFEGSADALVLWSRDVRIVDVNAAFTAIYGYTREEIIGSTFGDRLPTLDVARRIRMMHRALEGETGVLETRTVRKNGEAFDVEIRYLPIQHRGEPHVLAIARDITESRRAEAALRASEAQYRSIFEAATDSLQLLDARHRVVDVNPAYERMYGKRREDVVGKGLTELVPAQLRAERTALVDRALAGEIAELQTTGFRQDGTLFDMEVRCIPFEHRGERHVLGIARDITARKRAETALRASEERYRLLFEMESAAVVLVDADTLQLVDVNLAAVQTYGYTREELLSQTAADLSAEPEATVPSIREGQGALNIPLRWHRRKDGTVFPVEITANRLELEGRRIVLATIRDITERKHAEQALRDSEEQYRAIFNASADALVLRDADFRIVDVNATYESMSGFTRDEVLGVDKVIANPAEFADKIRALHGRALAGEAVELETTLVRRDGTRYELELRGVPILHRGAPHVLYLGRDVTARKAAEAGRQELESQLRQAHKMEAIGHLTGGIAHDFNNILTSVMGYVVLASERPAAESDEKLQEHLEQAQQACRRARDLIQQMLMFSRGKRGDARAVTLAALVDDSVRMLRATLPATIELAAQHDDRKTTVWADPVQLQQVVLNLAINARDAIEGPGRIGVVSFGARAAHGTCASCRRPVDGRFVELAVTDTGAGIAAGTLERMFEPFFTTKPVGRGSGMGLAIVHGIVHEYGGHLLVDSAPGRGTVFRVLLPEAPAERLQARKPALPRDRTRLALNGRVLLVDDESSVLNFMQQLLDGWGLQVTALSNPAEALRTFESNVQDFDLLLTDQTMPGITGIELARRVAALRPGIPILLYSGHGDMMLDTPIDTAGVTRVLPKPVEPAALHSTLADLLRPASVSTL